uniref:Reverse transcriptase Ty1/copia-type domain-containing protein n=1 Tax=Trichuris muris TaxID=70415 RepID=A0A5S6Q1Y2_TRIMR
MHFVTKDLGEVSSYLGMQIERQEDGAFLLHQHSKIEQLLKKVGMSEAKPMGTPIETGYLSTVNEFSVPLPNNVQYRQVIGSLLYIATVSRPDIALAVGLLCRRTESPTEYDWKCVKHVLRCLAGTKYMKLYVSATSEPILQGYVDADWAGDKADRKSTSGFMFHLGGSTISWSTRKLTSVALSSTEADYVAMAEACKELLWLRQLLEDFGIPQKSATTIFEDNQGCIRLIDSEKLNDRTKHISVRYHLLKDLRERRIIEVKYCPSHQMMADALTKPVSKEQLSRFVRQVRLLNCE